MTSPSQPAHDYDIAIVGYGPVGACLANLLGEAGIATIVLDREGPAYHLPRAVHFDDEVMRVLQTVGIADEMAKRVHVNPGMRFIDADGRLLLDWPRPSELSAQGWHASYRFHQPDLERLLRDAVGRFPCVEVATRSEVTQVEDNGDTARLTFTDLESGAAKTISAAYVIGCDGARSFVREVIGGGVEDFGFHERWLVVDVLLNGDKPELGDFSIQHCDAYRPATYVRGTGNRRRWEITVRAEEDTAEVETAAGTWRLVARWLEPHEAEIERTAVYTFHSVIANTWRKGRLLLAGDAAHQTPPFMGQGLCAGIRDVSNLAWKLVWCIRRGAADGLLDSYASERRPHAAAYIETALKLGRLINMEDPRQALEAAFSRADEAARAGVAKMSSITPRLGPGLAAADTAHRGMLAPQVRLADCRLIDDVSGYGFQLLTRRDLLAVAELTHGTLARAGIFTALVEDAPAVDEVLSALATNAVMIRPDRYVLGQAGTGDELRSLYQVVEGFGRK